jgi:hypothetical protein
MGPFAYLKSDIDFSDFIKTIYISIKTAKFMMLMKKIDNTFHANSFFSPSLKFIDFCFRMV